MSAAQLMRLLESRGASLSVRNGKLLCVAPPGSVTPDLKAALATHKAEIIAALSYRPTLAPPQIRVVDRNGDLPLSFAQQRLWFLHQLEPDDASYNIPAALRLSGDFNVAAFITAINEIIARHEVLRTTIATTAEGEAHQHIAPAMTIDAPVVDLSTLTEELREKEARKLAEEEAQRPFDLAQGPLLRVLLVDLGVGARHGQREHVVAITMHHIVSDGWSTDVFIREFVSLYEAFCAGRPSPLPPLKIQYADYAAWQLQWMQEEVLERQLGYWRAQLAGTPQALDLPTDRPRPPVQDHAGAIYQFSIAKDTVSGLRRVSQSQGATLFMTLLAAFQLLLARLGGQDDICVGVPIANRRRLELENLIGFFVNTLVVRTQVRGSERFEQLLARVRDTALGAQEHQDLPFERLVEELQPQRDMSVTPLFQAMFDLESAPVPDMSTGRLRSSPVAIESSPAKFDLSLTMTESEQSLRGSFTYATALFDDVTVRRFATYYVALLEEITARPDGSVGDFDIISDAERQQLLSGRTATLDAPKKCLHEVFEAQTALTPENLAVIFDDQRLSYREVNARANRLAHWLRRRGVAADTVVALCVNASPDMIVGMLAVLKAGGAYLPLDPMSPPERLALMVEEAAPLLVLTQDRVCHHLPEKVGRFRLDKDWSTIAAEDDANPSSGVRTQNLAYVIYTSGSTGRPKGVAVTHGGIGNLAEAQARFLELSGDDRVVQFASVTFDLAAEEIFSAFARSATLAICTEKAKSGWMEFLEFVTHHDITVLFLPTSFWSQLASWMAETRSQVPASLRLLCVGGDKASADALRLWRGLTGNAVRWINHYGPTEAAVATTVYELERDRQDVPDTIPIGRAIANTYAVILDTRLNLAPLSVAGEIHIGGAGLARGYLHRPELTAASFIPDPFGPPGARLYRTGDLGRRANGEIEFIGRIDHQVKIRGFRIEPGEIETALVHLPGVREVLVLADARSPGNERLVAYLTASSGAQLDAAELRTALQGKLPHYMIPTAFIVLDAFPLTVSGKVDRKALPPPSVTADGEHPHERPRSLTEWLLTKEFREILKTDSIGIHDNFFSLGGNSLSALKLADRIRRTVFSSLPVTAIFQAQTIGQLARWIADGEQRVSSPVVLMRPGGAAPPLFLIHPAGGSIIRYTALASALAPTRSVYGIQAWSVIDPSRRPSSIEEMAEDYVNLVRAAHPQGPYCLLGWSMGGATAMAMASVFETQGAEVGFVGLLDVTQPASNTARTGLASIAAEENPVLNYLRSFSRLQRVVENKDVDADLNAVLTPAAIEQLAEASARLTEKERFIYAALWGQGQGLWDNVSEALMESLYAEQLNSKTILAKFALPRVRAPLHVWWTETTLQTHGGAPVEWDDHTEGVVTTTIVSGDHESVIEDPAVHDGIATALKSLPQAAKLQSPKNAV